MSCAHAAKLLLLCLAFCGRITALDGILMTVVGQTNSAGEFVVVRLKMQQACNLPPFPPPHRRSAATERRKCHGERRTTELQPPAPCSPAETTVAVTASSPHALTPALTFPSYLPSPPQLQVTCIAAGNGSDISANLSLQVGCVTSPRWSLCLHCHAGTATTESIPTAAMVSSPISVCSYSPAAMHPAACPYSTLRA